MPLAARTLLLVLMFVMPSAFGAGKSILVYGDSLSAAYGIAQARGWVALVGERVKRERPDYSVVNASISGETSSGGLGRFDQVLREAKPAVLILELGANDGLRGLAPAQMEKNLGAIIERAQRAGARVLLLGMKMPPNYGPQYSEAFEAAYARLAKRYRVAFVPFMLEGFAEKPEYFQGDLLHPGEAAQPLIAERVWRALAPLLRRR